MSKTVTITHAYNLKYYHPRLWERIILFFCELRTLEQDGFIITYKTFNHRLYIYSGRKVTYLLPELPDGGVNKPWRN